MRARDLRDVIEVLILPSLNRAVDELTARNGSKRRARLLVEQSRDQLSGMMEQEPTATHDPELFKPEASRPDATSV